LNNLKRNKMENKIIPTAKELIETDYYHLHLDTDSICLGSIETAMIEFAKLHVGQALKEAEKSIKIGLSKKAKESILKSYPLDKIK
jgi:hypothetical protein